ncbi:MAG TPA: M20 family metallopeptidase [Candidatus Corynebacterium avicola]|uniref:Peptidase M20 domain-containing protein 2 n=1 Tax=Candidatus Corynebacterium avicola TaxID=2838527 RepID=A0A9D1RMV8_9CORY|nr:M20 family metallopeptidase [Candidatus Corynebacterium avicola]
MTDTPPIRDLSTPLPPSRTFLDQLQDATDAARSTAHHPGSSYDGAPEDLQTRLEQHIDAVRDDLVALMVDLGEHPETAFQEYRSAAAVTEVLNRLTPDGVTATVGVHGLETAIRAELPALPTTPPDAPVVAVLSEYDALPEIGHGCGHNVIATMGLGAFVGLARLRAESPEAVPSRVVFLGTPAEEGHTGKEYMAREGAFDDIDIAVMAHGYGDDVADQLWLGRRTLTVEFHGHSAHASAQPFAARNALDAASLMYQGVGLLRQQTPPGDRIHAIINSGGQRASVVPDHAEVTMYVRSPAPDTLRDLSDRVRDVAHGAALMAGCGVTLHWDEHPPSLPVRTNQALTGRWVQAQRRRGRDPYPRGVVSETLAASTDFGNVSYRLPGIHPLIKVSDSSVALHTREFAQATFTEAGHAAVVDGAFGLAATLLDVQLDPALAADVIAEFDAAGGALDVADYFS